MTDTMRDRVDALAARQADVRTMGGEEKIAAQHEAGKLTARERIDRLVEPGSFLEIGMHGRSPHPSMAGRRLPADGVVTGVGSIDGRDAAIVAYDFTTLAGSMGMTGEVKVARMRQTALQQQIPMVWLLDSAGARIQEATGSLFAGSGALFYEQVHMSGVVPQVAALMGPCAAGTAYIPGLADFVPMVKGRGSMALAGPHLVKAVTGEDTTAEELGGAHVHCDISGCGDLAVDDDDACLAAIREYLSFLPSSWTQRPPVRATGDPDDRRDESLLEIVPDNPRRAYDVRKVIRAIVDDGHIFEIKPTWARTIVTAFARMGGMPVGIVASNPKHLGGILDVDSADKAARFVNLCDAFNVPLVFLQDVPGFMVGTKIEREGIIRHGAKMLYAVSRATVPKITVVLRKAYGAGYYVMCGRAYGPDLIVAWPSAEISVMGPEGAVNIVFRKQIESAPADQQAQVRAGLIEQMRGAIDPYVAAEAALIDDVIDPRDTRLTVIRGLRTAQLKRAALPAKRHGVMPV